MQRISPNEHYLTSITVRCQSKRRLKCALKILSRNGIIWSESELLRRLAKMYLALWRGSGGKPAATRRYNISLKDQTYTRVSWYIDRVLHAILAERAMHSGESVSRILDFAIRNYTSQLLEACLRSPMPKHTRGIRNAVYWQKRWQCRKRHLPQLFITYQCETHENGARGLRYEQTYSIIPKTGLSPGDILYLLQYAA